MSAGKKNAKNNNAGDGARGTMPVHGGEGAEVAEESTQVVEYAAAIDVAKGSGMVCTRVPGSRPDRRRQKVWRVEATFKEVTALMDHLRCEGIQRLVLESTSDYWRIFYYLAEAAALEVWLVNARDVKHLPGRGKSDRLDCVWHCKLNERGMLMRSFVPPEPVRDLRALTRTRAPGWPRTRRDTRPGWREILEDALVKVSAVISDLFGTSGRRFLDALVAGERSPKALAALGDYRLKASTAELEAALTGRFRDIHATEIAVHLRLIDAINAEIALLDEQIEQHLPSVPRTAPVCTACGEIGGCQRPRLPGSHGTAPARAWPGGWMRSPGSAPSTPRPSSPTRHRPVAVPHPRARRRLGAPDLALQAVRGVREARPHRQGQPVSARRARPGRDDRGQHRYPPRRHVPPDRPQARQTESHRRGLPGHLRDRLDPHL